MNWEKLTSVEQLQELKSVSNSTPVLIFKHSTRCSISATTLGKFERHWDDAKAKGVKPYFLDLLAARPVSNQVESEFSIEHQSPQALLIKNGKCVYDSSHMAISFEDMIRHA